MNVRIIQNSFNLYWAVVTKDSGTLWRFDYLEDAVTYCKKHSHTVIETIKVD